MKVLNLFSKRSLHLIHILPFLCHEVAANTEIIVFSPSREPTVDLPWDALGNGSTLHPTDNEWRGFIEPAALHTPTCSHHTPFSSTCLHALWLLLDLDDDKWASYATFTLRVSWAASTPVDVEMRLYTPQEVLPRHADSKVVPSRSHLTTRARFARIHAVHVGVVTPTHELARRAPHAQSLSPPPPPPNATFPLSVVLEPVYAGVLPASLVSTVGVLVPVVLVAAALVPWITAFLAPHVQRARRDANAETFKQR